MWLPDANILIYAFHSARQEHGAARDWLSQALIGENEVLFCDLTELALLRISTQIEKTPKHFEHAWDFLRALKMSNAYRNVRRGEEHEDIFLSLIKNTGLLGSHLTDLWLAALAIENDATLVTADRDFEKINGLKTFNPINS